MSDHQGSFVMTRCAVPSRFSRQSSGGPIEDTLRFFHRSEEADPASRSALGRISQARRSGSVFFG
jgi:hypothetical protein